MPRDLVLPTARFELASFGELLSEPSRVTMLLSLMDGRARPATELANLAAVSAPTASFHLRRLVEGGLVRVDPRGRHRYFSLANAEVADALEAVARLSPAPRSRAKPSGARASSALAHARTCYQHLAGTLGVAWLAALERGRFVALRGGALALTRRGVEWLESTGGGPTRVPTGKLCLDWTERKNHLGGPLGALLTQRLFELKWIARRGDGRGVRVTVSGQRELARQLHLSADVLSGR